MPQPSSFSPDLVDKWATWVFDNGLPALPDDLAAGESVPVACWTGPHFGAVLRIDCFVDDDDDAGGTALSEEIDLYERTDEGWGDLGNGGGNWPTTPLFRARVVD